MNKWYTMKAAGKLAEISIYADIGMWGITAAMFKKELTSLGAFDTINVRINSYGGEVFDGFAIYNLLKEQKADVNIIIDGIAASIASVIAMAGKTIKMHSNAMLMIHNPSVMMIGESEELRKGADVLDKLKARAIEAYRTHANGLSENDIADLMNDSTYMTAQEAKDWGFIDEVIDAIEVNEPETNVSTSIPVNYRKTIFTNSIPAGIKPANKEAIMKCPKCGKHEILEGQTMCIECARAQERSEATAFEQSRIVNITSICSAAGLSQEFTNKAIKSNKNVDELSVEISEEIKKMKALPPVDVAKQDVSVVKDDADKFRQHAVNSLAVMVGIEKDVAVKAEIRKGEMIGSLHGLMRRDLQRHGVDSMGLNAVQLVEKVITMAGTGSSDLPAVLGDLTNKNMEVAYNEAPVTWDKWCRIKEVPNFNSQKLIKMSGFSDIDDLPEGMPFKNKKLSDKYETVSISGKGNVFNVSFEAMVNDTLDAIASVPRAMVQAVARRQNKDVYDLLTYNTLVGPLVNEDGVALFDLAAHSNLIATSGVPSVTSIGAAERKLLEMPLLKAEARDAKSYANVPAKYLITGTANRITTLQVLNTVFDFSKTTAGAGAGAGVYNPYAGNQIIPIFDAYLQYLLTTASAANAWYLAADPMQMGHCVVAFLSGYRTPSLRNEKSAIGDARGFTWEISADWGVGYEDYRGIVHNDGK